MKTVKQLFEDYQERGQPKSTCVIEAYQMESAFVAGFTAACGLLQQIDDLAEPQRTTELKTLSKELVTFCEAKILEAKTI